MAGPDRLQFAVVRPRSRLPVEHKVNVLAVAQHKVLGSFRTDLRQAAKRFERSGQQVEQLQFSVGAENRELIVIRAPEAAGRREVLLPETLFCVEVACLNHDSTRVSRLSRRGDQRVVIDQKCVGQHRPDGRNFVRLRRVRRLKLFGKKNAFSVGGPQCVITRAGRGQDNQPRERAEDSCAGRDRSPSPQDLTRLRVEDRDCSPGPVADVVRVDDRNRVGPHGRPARDFIEECRTGRHRAVVLLEHRRPAVRCFGQLSPQDSPIGNREAVKDASAEDDHCRTEMEVTIHAGARRATSDGNGPVERAV